jgi:hypothetical protein
MSSKALGKLVAPAALAIVALAVLAARPAQQSTTWEYAVFVGSDDGRAAWVTADTIYIESDMREMLWRLGAGELPSWAPQDERWGAMIMNLLGSRGWELIAVESGGFRGDNMGPLNEPHRTYYLKR